MKIKNQNRIPSKYVLLILIVVCGILMGAEQLTGGKGPSQFCGQLYHHSYAERNRIYRTLDRRHER